jgi:CRP-like cAMP-binding protein
VSINKLLKNFDKYIPIDKIERKDLILNKTEKEDLTNRVVERKIKRKQFILQENDVCKHYTFVVEGCFKKYYVDKKGIEHNLQFIAEDDWVMEIESFYSEKPSQFYIEAIEPSVVLQISKPDLLHLFSHHPKFDRNFRVIVENRFVEIEHRVLQNISSTAEERYLTFLKQYPKLSNRLPNTQIASYLGITPEFLSKIRNNISKK